MIPRIGRLCWSAIAWICTLTLALPSATQPATVHAADDLIGPVFVHVPPLAASGEKPHVLVALHGLSSNGRAFAGPLLEPANRNNWIVVAPTLRYGDWWQVEALVREDTTFARWLTEYLDRLVREHGLPADDRVLLFGFSRGAGLLSRFALLHPERVAASAVLSSGSYTLAATSDAAGRPLAFPFGSADLEAQGGRPFDAQALQSVRWLVGVGEVDDQPKDVPQVWTPYIGPTRLERARAFSASVRAAGADVSLRIFAKTRHTLTHEMRTDALSFLREAEPAHAVGPPPAVVRSPRAGVTPPSTPTSTPTSAPTPLATAAPLPTNASASPTADTRPQVPAKAVVASLPANAAVPLPVSAPAALLVSAPVPPPANGPAPLPVSAPAPLPLSAPAALPVSAPVPPPAANVPAPASAPVPPAENAPTMLPVVDDVPLAPDELSPMPPVAGDDTPPPDPVDLLQPAA